MSVNEIYYEKEEKFIPKEERATKDFLDSFYREIGINFDNVFPVYGINADDYLTQFNFIRYYLNNIQRKHLEVFYDMLKSTDYDMRTEIQFFCRLIGSSIKESDRDNAIAYACSSPIIGACYDNYGVVHIESDYGTILFKSIFEYFDDDVDINRFLKKYELSKNCHNVSWELMSYLDKVNLVTSLLKSGFKAQYYHTYLEQNGIIIDPASGITTNYTNYNGIYLPENVSVVSKEDADSEYEAAINTHRFDDSVIKPKALIIALNKEMEK